MKNIRMTKIAIILMGILCAVMTVMGPKIVSYVMQRPSVCIEGTARYVLLLTFGYILAGVAFSCLYSLYRLISRIEKDEVFVEANVASLRAVAIEVGLAAAISLFLGITCATLMLAVAVMAAFMVLIILVVRSSFERAVRMKDELDLTI